MRFVAYLSCEYQEIGLKTYEYAMVQQEEQK